MHKKPFKLMFLPLLTALASCGGYSLGYIVSGDMYISANFLKNYYCHWDSELKSAKVISTTDVTSETIYRFDDIENIDDVLLINNPYKDSSKYPFEESRIRQYAKDYRMMNLDQSFYYGVQSKLFDGEAYCDSYYQRHRVQSNEGGFSVRFTKESDELQYFAMQFKATTNNQLPTYPAYSYTNSSGQEVDNSVLINNPEKEGKDEWLYHYSKIKLNVDVYCRSDNGINAYRFTTDVEFSKVLVDVGSGKTNNQSETNHGHAFKFVGFRLFSEEGGNKNPLSRCVGFSISFTILNDDLIEHNKALDPTSNIDYALFIYEVFLPYTYWH